MFLVCLATTGWAWYEARQNAAQKTFTRFEYRTDRIGAEILEHLEEYDRALRNVAGLIASTPVFERSQWRRYFERSVSAENYPGREALGYAPRVPESESAAHEAKVRAEGIANYTLKSGRVRPEYFPVAYLKSFQKQGTIELGLDLASDPAASEAMSQARDSGKSVMTGPVFPERRGEGDRDRLWVLLVPVYTSGAAISSLAERREALQGFALEAFDPMETVGSSLGPDAKVIGLKAYYGAAALFICPEMQRLMSEGFAPTLKRTVALNFGERTWTLEFAALPPFLAMGETNQPTIVLISGVLISVLLSGLVGAMANTRAQAMALARERTNELRAALVDVEASETRLRAVFDHVLDAIITIDERGIIQTYNPAAEKIFGYGQGETLGQNIRMLMPAPYREHHDEYLTAYLTTGKAKIMGIGREVVGLRKDGTTFPMELGISEMRIGEQRYFCGIVRDITQRKQADQALRDERQSLEVRVKERTEVLTKTNQVLQQEIVERKRVERELTTAREQALQAAEAKAGFLANMSHEIRTPMNAVIGMTALLAETALTPEQRNYLETIRVSGDALLGIINDILDFSKIESGMLELEARPVELGACVEDAFDMLASKAAEKNIDLLYALGDDVPAWILSDAARLRQILVNLLSNAVKFTESGEVCLTVAQVGGQNGKLKLQFAVRDTGIGIPRAKMGHLFKAFSQADSSTTRKYGGSGLGLAICARLTQLMGGDIWLESEEGLGSTFYFTVLTGLTEPPAAQRHLTHHAPELTGKRVLLVDDNPTNLHILEIQCRRWGLDVACASGGQEALALLRQGARFDVIVLDMRMPGMDGIQLAGEIHALLSDLTPALVMLSSTIGRKTDTATAQLFTTHLPKPVKHSQLFNVLMEVLGAERMTRLPDPSQRLDTTLGRRLPLNILVVEDSTINQKLAVGILDKLGYSGDIAANGAEAMELLRINRYDLVFMDLQMPLMDGIEATRRIALEWPADSRPRIIAMTANALPGDREKCLEAGMDDYLAKPILPIDVQRIIERWANPGRYVSPAMNEPQLIDAQTVSELQALDEPGKPSLLRGLVQDYLTEAPASISEIKGCAARDDVASLASRAHKLSGTSLSIGASGMADICRRIEQQVAGGQSAGVMSLVDQLELRFAKTRTELSRFL